jgi:photosystem II stability/assembly factor-like uncharacterized protein
MNEGTKMQIIKRPLLVSVLSACLVIICLTVGYFISLKTSGDTQTKPVRQETVRLEPVAPRYEYGRYSFSDVAILDNGVMWAVGYDGQSPQRIRYSTDGGKSWEAKVVPTGGWILNAINFADAMNGWAVGAYGLIIHTSDGGQSWQQIKAPTRVDLKAVSFVSREVGYVAGQSGNYHDERKEIADFDLVILRTSDGGQSWRACYEYHKTGDASQIEKSIWRLATLSGKVAVAVIDGKSLLRTEDGGTTWQAFDPAIKGGLYSISFSTNGTGWAIGEKGAFYQTLDSGRAWHKLTDLPEKLSNQDWWSIDFADAKRGMVVGSRGAMAVTDDAGRTWSEVRTDTVEDLRLVRLRGTSGLVLGSQRVYQVVVGASK